jgi:replicative DNA helicase
VSELRDLATTLSCPVIAISSQNRTGQGSAKLTSLKETGDLEFSADSAIFLVTDDESDEEPPDRAVKLLVGKNRFGDVAEIELLFMPSIGLFVEGRGYAL